jgi:hypothetical protein
MGIFLFYLSERLLSLNKKCGKVTLRCPYRSSIVLGSGV